MTPEIIFIAGPVVAALLFLAVLGGVTLYTRQ